MELGPADGTGTVESLLQLKRKSNSPIRLKYILFIRPS
jgi:hypothetical protein